MSKKFYILGVLFILFEGFLLTTLSQPVNLNKNPIVDTQKFALAWVEKIDSSNLVIKVSISKDGYTWYDAKFPSNIIPSNSTTNIWITGDNDGKKLLVMYADGLINSVKNIKIIEGRIISPHSNVISSNIVEWLNPIEMQTDNYISSEPACIISNDGKKIIGFYFHNISWTEGKIVLYLNEPNTNVWTKQKEIKIQHPWNTLKGPSLIKNSDSIFMAHRDGTNVVLSEFKLIFVPEHHITDPIHRDHLIPAHWEAQYKGSITLSLDPDLDLTSITAPVITTDKQRLYLAVPQKIKGSNNYRVAMYRSFKREDVLSVGMERYGSIPLSHISDTSNLNLVSDLKGMMIAASYNSFKDRPIFIKSKCHIEWESLYTHNLIEGIYPATTIPNGDPWLGTQNRIMWFSLTRFGSEITLATPVERTEAPTTP